MACCVGELRREEAPLLKKESPPKSPFTSTASLGCGGGSPRIFLKSSARSPGSKAGPGRKSFRWWNSLSDAPLNRRFSAWLL